MYVLRQLPPLFRRTCPAARLLVFLFLIFLMPEMVLGAGQTTAFLPLKINTGKDGEQLTARADQLLLE